MNQTPQAMPDKINLGEILTEMIKDISKAKMFGDNAKYEKGLENLQDIIISYWDKDFEEKIEEVENEIREKVKNLAESDPKKKFYIMQKNRNKFRLIMELISRSGFFPEKSVDGVIDEKVVSAFWISTGQITEDEHLALGQSEGIIPIPEEHLEQDKQE